MARSLRKLSIKKPPCPCQDLCALHKIYKNLLVSYRNFAVNPSKIHWVEFLACHSSRHSWRLSPGIFQKQQKCNAQWKTHDLAGAPFSGPSWQGVTACLIAVLGSRTSHQEIGQENLTMQDDASNKNGNIYIYTYAYTYMYIIHIYILNIQHYIQYIHDQS